MKILRSLFVIVISALISGEATDEVSMSNLVKENGYPLEEHFVTTEDGYTLTVHRIPHGRNNSSVVGRPVLLQHGILCSAACWVVSRPDKSLAFILADQGYDVWMPNSRGTSYSREHRSLTTDDADFWDFSFHEMGVYDLPASIDYILEKTNNSKLEYIGHSQGTTIFFVMTSMKPEYNQKVVHMSALAPIAFLDHTRGTIHGLMFFAEQIKLVAELTGTHEVLADTTLIHWIEKQLCKAQTFTELICENILFIVAGYDSQQLNGTLLPIIGQYTPEGTSIQNLVHFSQNAKSGGQFKQYDYGWFKNLMRYGQWGPPSYNLSQISAPVTLHYANNDWLSGIADVQKLKQRIPSSNDNLVPFFYFNHLDFMWAVDVWGLLYKNLLETMKRYEN